MLSDDEVRVPAGQRVAPLRLLQEQPDTLLVHEIYRSVQGESTWAGVPCVFVRLTGCHLRCRYCDTAHAFYEGKPMTTATAAAAAMTMMGKLPLVEITGGEPLLQPVHTLIDVLVDAGKTVLVETSGAVSLHNANRRANYIVDVKTPGSGEEARNHRSSWAILKPGHDEVKFVVTDETDYAYARDLVQRGSFPQGVTVLFSAAAPMMEPRWLAERIIADQLDVRFQLQLHKVLWGNRSGV
jgi:7-carboxy-7-deazaguanine synthase